MKDKPSWNKLAPYAGRWVALIGDQVAGVGWTAAEARRAAKRNRPKEWAAAVIFVPAVKVDSDENENEGGEAKLKTLRTSERKITLPEWPWQMVRRLARSRQTHVWLVGGAVRDALLERPLHDWDFAVDRGALKLARAVADAFGGAYYSLDVERGTGRVVLRTDAGTQLDLDFARLRGDDLDADLTTRDFTINALALDAAGALLDPTGGLDDLAARRIRATSEGVFRADPVRMLRAVRMAAELGFQIEPQTASWIRRDVVYISEPSAERVRDELVKLLALPGAVEALQRLDAFGLLQPILPELDVLKGVTQSPPHRFDVWQHSLLVLDTLETVVATITEDESPTPSSIAGVPTAAWSDLARALKRFASDVDQHLAIDVSGGRDRALVLKLAALLHDVGKRETWSQDERDGRIHFYNHEPVGAEIAARRLQALRFSSDEIARVRVMIGQHLRPAHLARAERLTRRAVYRYFRATGCAGVDVVLLSLADHLSTYGPNLQDRRWMRRLSVAEQLLTHCFERYHETIEPPPWLTGHDLMDTFALSPGPQIGRLLETIREAQAAGELQDRESALAFARRLLDKSAD
ncbi:MAG TPA: HD domain-containing protein [Chloroflexi bacterium]|nr:HD domain-containing protein [Chloroflexota bacterium]